MRLALAVLAVLLVAPASASAAGLRVASVSSPPRSVEREAGFTVQGRVANSGARARAASLSFRFRSSGGRTYASGGLSLKALPRRRQLGYRTTVLVPRAVPAGTYTFQACVKRSRLEKASCRSARRKVRVVVPAAAPVAPPVSPAPPAAVAAPAPPPVETPAPPAEKFTPGARTLNDPLFPGIGNGGYDATSYDIDLDYVITSKVLGGTVTMTAEATQDLSELSLDLTDWNVVSSVTVDGVAATFAQEAEKLVVTPAAGIDSGDAFEVAVTYSGVQEPYVDSTGTAGWVPDATYGAIVVSQPAGAMGWFPNNNVPSDRATYRIAIGVPNAAPWEVVGPGLKTAENVQGAITEFVWEEDAPTPSYLIGLGIGQFTIDESTTTPDPPTNPTAIPFTTAISVAFTNPVAIKAGFDQVPAMQDFFAEELGMPYPFSSAGAIMPFQNVDYALETQSKPIYAISTSTSPAFTGPPLEMIAHETAHQWLGNHTTLTRWDDIWLNEGPTEFMSWHWSAEKSTGADLDDRWGALYTGSTDGFWEVPPAAPPTAGDMFDADAMYDRGAMTMAVVREILGAARFKNVMTKHLTATGHAFGTATTEQLIALVKAEDALAHPGNTVRPGRWDELFEQWLYTSYTGDPSAGNRPDITPATFEN